jgi:hypothetical protein
MIDKGSTLGWFMVVEPCGSRDVLLFVIAYFHMSMNLLHAQNDVKYHGQCKGLASQRETSTARLGQSRRSDTSSWIPSDWILTWPASTGYTFCTGRTDLIVAHCWSDGEITLDS